MSNEESTIIQGYLKRMQDEYENFNTVYNDLLTKLNLAQTEYTKQDSQFKKLLTDETNLVTIYSSSTRQNFDTEFEKVQSSAQAKILNISQVPEELDEFIKLANLDLEGVRNQLDEISQNVSAIKDEANAQIDSINRELPKVTEAGQKAIEDMNKVVNQVTASGQTLQQQINELDLRLSGIVNNQSNISKDITAIQETNKAIKASQEALLKLIDKTDDRIDQINQQIGDIVKIQTDIDTLETEKADKTFVDAQLAQKAKHEINHINVVGYGVDNTGTQNCSDKINQIIQENDFSTLYFPDGVYNIDKEINLNNYCNLQLSKNAVLKCVVPLERMIFIRRTAERIKQFISGGVIDGYGNANTNVFVDYTANFQIYNMVVKNALLKNIHLKAGYEIYVENIHIDNELAYETNPNLVGLHVEATDSVFKNIVVKNNTTGVINNSASSEFYSVHIWSNKLDRLPHTYGLIANDETHVVFFYADTCAVGVKANGGINVYLQNSKFGFSQTYLSQLPDLIPLFIDNPSATIYLNSCRMSSYGQNVVIGTQMGRVRMFNCSFSSPFNTSSQYTNIRPQHQSFYRINLSNFTIPANGSIRVTIPIEGIIWNDFYFFGVSNLTSANTWYKSYLTNGNLNLVFFNNGASSIPANDVKVTLTHVPNNNLPFTTINHTV